MASNRQCRPHHEDGPARERKDRQGSKGMHAGMRQRVHLLHHERGQRKVPAGEAQDGQRRRHLVCHDFPGLRELLGSAQNLPLTVPRDPPRKSEQACWGKPVQCSRVRCRWQSRPRGCPTPERSERRRRDGRQRQHRFWLHRPQRKQRRRILNAEPRSQDLGDSCSSNLTSHPALGRHLGHRKTRRYRGRERVVVVQIVRFYWLRRFRRLSTIGLVREQEAIFTHWTYRDASTPTLLGTWLGLNNGHESGRVEQCTSGIAYSQNFGLDFSIAHAIPCSTLITLYSIL